MTVVLESVGLLSLFATLAVAVVIVVTAVLAFVSKLRQQRYKRSALSELHCDWWSGFEEEFRTYAAELSQPSDGERRRPGGRT